MPSPFGTVSLARALSGVSDNSDVDDTEIQAGLDYGYQMLVLFTGKNDWTGSESVADQCDRAVEYFCGSWIKSWWQDPDNKSQEFFNRAKSMCVAIMENMKMVTPNQPTDASFTSTAYTYRTKNLNPDALPYKSPRTDY
ncbi:hypothetical protein [Glutamicibacter sp.]|jgi:hypothetical protein|uniref:hypothetical protein n=1 Tax=Glutamicibacter sp. TaxID=1931995 RepID=UPI002B45B776|nr:hypothetical protein [Glutamicibacter sp.]HJX79134.1 hypothetical protein [Glutamicibacter sp.]